MTSHDDLTDRTGNTATPNTVDTLTDEDRGPSGVGVANSTAPTSSC